MAPLSPQRKSLQIPDAPPAQVGWSSVSPPLSPKVLCLTLAAPPPPQAGSRSLSSPHPALLDAPRAAPDWARDLKDMLRPSNVVKNEPRDVDRSKEEVRALLTEVAASEGHPQWAQDLLSVLGAPVKNDDAPSGAGIRLPTGKGVRLRIKGPSGAQHPEKVPAEPVPPGSSNSRVAEYEEAAMHAMVKVKDQRKLEAAERRAEKERLRELKRSAAGMECEPAHKRPAAVKLEPGTPLKLEPSLKRRPAAATPTAASGRPRCPLRMQPM